MMFSCFRYQVFLQVKRDVLQGRLPLSFEIASDLSALAVQCKSLNLQNATLYNKRRGKVNCTLEFIHVSTRLAIIHI